MLTWKEIIHFATKETQLQLKELKNSNRMANPFNPRTIQSYQTKVQKAHIQELYALFMMQVNTIVFAVTLLYLMLQ